MKINIYESFSPLWSHCRAWSQIKKKSKPKHFFPQGGKKKRAQRNENVEKFINGTRKNKFWHAKRSEEREREKESEEGVRDTTKMKRIKKTARKELFEQWKQNMDWNYLLCKKEAIWFMFKAFFTCLHRVEQVQLDEEKHLSFLEILNLIRVRRLLRKSKKLYEGEGRSVGLILSRSVTLNVWKLQL